MGWPASLPFWDTTPTNTAYTSVRSPNKEPWEKVFWTWCVKGLIYRQWNALVMTSPELVQCPTESWSSTEMRTSVPSHFHHLVLGHHIWLFAMLCAGHNYIRQGSLSAFQITLPTFQGGYYLLPLHVLILALNPCLLKGGMFSCPRHGCHLSLPSRNPNPRSLLPGAALFHHLTENSFAGKSLQNYPIFFIKVPT